VSAQSNRITYFLTHPDPSIRLLALRELAQASEDDPEVVRAKAEIPETPAVRAVLNDMHPQGYWVQIDKRTGKEYGAGVEYGAFSSTHYRLAYLAELGMDKSDERIALVAERYLGLQEADGDFLAHMSCLLGQNLRTFQKLGFGSDPRVRSSLELLLRTARPDFGYLCDMHEKPALGVSGKPLKRPKSCFRGSAKVLFAFSYFPEIRTDPRLNALCEYFLFREGVFSNSDPARYVVRDVIEPSFPFTWRADVVQVLYALARLGCGGDPRLERSWHTLGTLRDDDGFITLSWSPTQSPWKPGKRGKPSDWVTLYADIAEQRAERS